MSATWHDEVLMAIPSVDGATPLARMLPTLRVRPSSVVVLDQGSTDGTEALCRAAGVGFVQLGRPHTMSEAGDIAARLAKERGCRYLCLASNAITFGTDVLAELRDALARDPALGMVAPSVVLVDERTGTRRYTARMAWDLDRVEFLHDGATVDRAVQRLESDFCALTCAMVPLSVIERIGFLDDEFGCCHEDADFGFRLRQAGYASAYLPQSQIDHHAGPDTTPARKASLARSRMAFIGKHLGYGVNPNLPSAAAGGLWDEFGCDLGRVLPRSGLVEVSAPELVMASPGVDTRGYCYTDAEAAVLPTRWAKHAGRTRAILTPAAAMPAVFRAAGFADSFHVPAGVETDVFHPWGPSRRAFAAPTVLVLAHGWRADWLATVLDAWRGFVAGGGEGWLVLAGHGLAGVPGTAPDEAWQSGTTAFARHAAERIEVQDQLAPMPAGDLACLYRGMDFVIPDPGDAGHRMTLLRALACGVPPIAGPGAVLADILPRHGLAFAPGGLRATLQQAVRLGTADRAALSEAAMLAVRARSTLRHTVAGLRAALSQLQVRDPAETLRRIQARLATEDQAAAPAPEAPRRAMARRVQGFGRLALTLGTTWEEKGLRVAARTIGTELRFFLDGRRRAIVPDAAPEARPEPPVADSTLLVGYIDAHLGLGQSLRGLARAMETADCRFAVYPVGLGVEGRRGEPYMPGRTDLVQAHAVNVLEIATNELPAVRAHVGEYHFDRSYNILRTYWELARAPDLWRPDLAGIQEMWAPTRFVAESFRPVFDGVITVVPPCIDLPPPPEDGHAQFGLEPGRFHFLFSFDYYSFPQRKNPLAVIRAFRRAFPDPRAKVGLVVKSTGAAGHFPEVKLALREAARHDGRITIVDEWLNRDEMLALMAATDCYVSLHRSEGFGLGMAEAMALGKPVIGTDYSGNTDFLSDATGYPVAFTLRPVREDEYVHTQDQVWAEPDEAACAVAMQAAVTDRPGTQARAAAGQRFIQDHFGPRAVGALVRRRLAEIAARPIAQPAPG